MQFTQHVVAEEEAQTPDKKRSSVAYKSAYAQDRAFIKKVDQQRKSATKKTTAARPTTASAKFTSPAKFTKNYQRDTASALHSGVSPSKMRANGKLASTQKSGTKKSAGKTI